jgi:hypothetical protein
MSKVFIKNPSELYDLRQYFYDIKVNYEFIRSGNSVILKAGDGITYYTYSFIKTSKNDKGLPLNEVSFISKVKRHILSEGLEKKPALYKSEIEIKYFYINQSIKIGSVLHDCIDVDLNSAYWQSAKMQGYIDEPLFKEGMTKDKRIRLAAIGTFAKQTETFKYNGRTEKYTGAVKEKYPQVFFNQAWAINQVMEKCKEAIKKDMVFYWVDGIKVKTQKAVSICQDIINEHGFSSKLKPAKYIERTPNSFIVDEYKEKPLVFNIPN